MADSASVRQATTSATVHEKASKCRKLDDIRTPEDNAAVADFLLEDSCAQSWKMLTLL